MGAVIGVMVESMGAFVIYVAKKFIETLPGFLLFSVVSSISISIFLLGGIFGPLISILFIYAILFKRLKYFWQTGLYLNNNS